MEAVLSILFLLIAVIVADVLNKKWPIIPVAFYQIFLGIMLSISPFYEHYLLEPEMFMLAIIAPLLFIDAQEMSRKELTKNLRSILSLAIGLVVVSVILGGLYVQWILPSIPFALAFALAAIVTPTDAVAVQSITKKMAMSKDTMEVLKGESLFNDASGIVAFHVSLAAFLTGTFSIGSSVIDFVISFFGGLLLGALLGYLVVRLRLALSKHNFEDTFMLVVIQILTPFVIYIIAEEIGVSGILAVVAAGLAHGVEKDVLKLTSTKIRVVTESTWSVIGYALNGFVFVLLGLTLPSVIEDLIENHMMGIGKLILASIGLYIVLVLIRYLWIRYVNPFIGNKSENSHPIIMSLSGVHGTITLSMALSLPLLASGADFPMRNEIIFIASVVILCSLIIPTVILPIILPEKEEGINIEDIETAHQEMLQHTIDALQEKTDVNINNLQPVLKTLRDQLYSLETKKGMKVPDANIVKELLAKVTKVEKEAVEQLSISQRTKDFYIHFVQSMNKQLSNRGFATFKFRIKQIFFRSNIRKLRKKAKNHVVESSRLKGIMKLCAEFSLAHEVGRKAGISFLEEQLLGENYTEADYLLRYYQRRQQHETDIEVANVENERNALFREAFQMEYIYVQDMLEQEKITRETANQLKEQITYDEMVYGSSEE